MPTYNVIHRKLMDAPGIHEVLCNLESELAGYVFSIRDIDGADYDQNLPQVVGLHLGNIFSASKKRRGFLLDYETLLEVVKAPFQIYELSVVAARDIRDIPSAKAHLSDGIGDFAISIIDSQVFTIDTADDFPSEYLESLVD